MEANIIIEINSDLDDKQNGCRIFSEIYFMKMLIKVNQIRTVSFNMHALCSMVISRLYIKYNKRYRSWQPLKMVIFYSFGNIFVPALWRHICMMS